MGKIKQWIATTTRLEDAHEFVQEFTGNQRYILDYLIEEVIRRQPEHLQSFLLETSILDCLSGPLCDAVTGRSDSQSSWKRWKQPMCSSFHWIEERQMVSLPPPVRGCAASPAPAGEPGGAQENHRRASRWYEQQGMIDQAIEHALAARDFSRAEELLEPAIGSIIDRQGRLHQVAQWIETLPADRRREHPQLNFWYALVLMLIGRAPDYETPLLEAEAAWREQEDRPDWRKLPACGRMLPAGAANLTRRRSMRPGFSRAA
jgi:LuxR family transcriptional regulator, maltose regulon positive regulatory protein